MRVTLNVACSASLALLLACASTAAPARPLAARGRVGTADFSIEVPPGQDWHLRRTDFSLTLERRATSWLHVSETVLICVSRHPVGSPSGKYSEAQFASQFLDAEKAILYQSEAEDGFWIMAQQERTLHGKRLYQLTYHIDARTRSDDSAWKDEVLHRDGEITVYFPDGSLGPYFYCFEVRVTHRPGHPDRPETLRLIDRVIDSFRRDAPADRPEPASLGSR